MPFKFAKLARSPGHVLENSLEYLGDDLGHQLRTQGPSKNIADVMLLGTRMINLRGLSKRVVLDNYKKHRRYRNSKAHIRVGTGDVDVDQVTSVEGGRTHGLIRLGFPEDTLDGRVNP